MRDDVDIVVTDMMMILIVMQVFDTWTCLAPVLYRSDAFESSDRIETAAMKI
jgi:hypothetical protein